MDKKYDVFISFKNTDANGNRTKDSEIANALYNFLTSRGLQVFYSNIELEYIGTAQYPTAIANALESSSFLIAVGCSRENFESRWVKAEWESFLNNIRRGTKTPPTDVYVLYENMTTDELPWFLRDQQSFNASKKDSFERLYNFIYNAINSSNGKNIDYETIIKKPDFDYEIKPQNVEKKNFNFKTLLIFVLCVMIFVMPILLFTYIKYFNSIETPTKLLIETSQEEIIKKTTEIPEAQIMKMPEDERNTASEKIIETTKERIVEIPEIKPIEIPGKIIIETTLEDETEKPIEYQIAEVPNTMPPHTTPPARPMGGGYSDDEEIETTSEEETGTPVEIPVTGRKFAMSVGSIYVELQLISVSKEINSFTVRAVGGRSTGMYVFGISNVNDYQEILTWYYQENEYGEVTFDDLEANTTYYVFAYKEADDEYEKSAMSEVLIVTIGETE